MGGLRKLWKAALVAALAALVGAWFRHREPEIVDEEAPGSAAWPPLAPLPGQAPPVDAGADDAGAADAGAEPAERDTVDGADDADQAIEDDDTGDGHSDGDAWIAPDAEGDCPATHPVKVKRSSGIFHVPGGLAYERTNADRCYCDTAAAEADGFRAAKR